MTGSLRFDSVSVRRGGRDILSLQDELLPIEGGVTALVGPNGAGKSTLLRLLQGLIVPDRGALYWPNAAPPARAILLQNPALLRRSVADNVDFVLKRRSLPKAIRAQQIETLLGQARLADEADRPARRLSGGQQRRLALAQALALAPEMLLLDEPTAGLDPASAAALEAMVRRVAGEGLTVILSSHELGQVRRLADRALFIHSGHIAASGALPDLFDEAETANPELAAFLRGDLLC